MTRKYSQYHNVRNYSFLTDPNEVMVFYPDDLSDAINQINAFSEETSQGYKTIVLSYKKSLWVKELNAEEYPLNINVQYIGDTK